MRDLDKVEFYAIGGIVLFFAGIAACIAGWVNNVIWMFEQTEVVPMILGAAGAFFPPLGAIHGIWLWF